MVSSPKIKDTSWESVAPWYDKHLESDDSYHQKVVLPNILRLVSGALSPAEIGKNTKGTKDVLDLACGQGFFSGAFRTLGARVVGIDSSPSLIDIAKNKNKGQDFFVGKADQLTSLKNDSFDVVTIILAIQNIKEVDAVFTEVKRVLRTGGHFFIVMNHPCFRIPKTSSWGYDDKNNVQYRRLDSYISESTSKILAHPSDPKSPSTISFHRPLQFYVKALSKNGMAITKLEEWISHKKSEKTKRGEVEDVARKEIPLFLCIEAMIQ